MAAAAAFPDTLRTSAVARAARTGASIISWASFTFVVGLAAVVLAVPALTSAFSLTVTTGSMSPELRGGSLLFVRPVDPNAIEVGDIVTFLARESTEPTTHRVVDIEGAGPDRRFVTKGDANAGPDLETVPDKAVLGRVWFQLRGVGAAKNSIASPVGLAALASIGFCWLFGRDLVDKIAAFRPASNGPAMVLARSDSMPAGVSISETDVS